MRLLEAAPGRYDFGIRLLSLGHINQLYRRAAQLVRRLETTRCAVKYQRHAFRARNGQKGAPMYLVAESD
jgi:hypothetical protein